MKMRLPLQIIIGLILGFGFGLLYSWIISPRQQTDLSPASLRSDFKDQYRSAIAVSFSSTGDIDRAIARLALLDDPDPSKSLAAQAQRMISTDGEATETITALALLANALQDNRGNPTGIPTNPDVSNAPATQEQAAASIATSDNTEVPQAADTTDAESIPTVSVNYTPTARPAPTSTSLPGIPFSLNGQETICDPVLAEGLLSIVVVNSANKPVAGVKIVVNWNSGEDYFFTGLKPELGNGYADFVMLPDITYSISVGSSASPTSGLTAPVCQTTDGDIYYGSLRLSFQQQ